MGNTASVACIAGASAGLAVAASYNTMRLLLRDPRHTARATELSCVRGEVVEASRKVEQLIMLVGGELKSMSRALDALSTGGAERGVVVLADTGRPHDDNLHGLRITGVIADHGKAVKTRAQLSNGSPQHGHVNMGAEISRVRQALESINSSIGQVLDMVAASRDATHALTAASAGGAMAPMAVEGSTLESIYLGIKQVLALVAAPASPALTAACVEGVVARKLLAVESSTLEILKHLKATNDAIGKLPESVGSTVERYSTYLHIEHEELHRLISSK